MAKYQKIPEYIEAITFKEFIDYGKSHGGNIVDGYPWSFQYEGHAVTHENNECYLISDGTIMGVKFTPNDMLVIHPKNILSVLPISMFNQIYQRVY